MPPENEDLTLSNLKPAQPRKARKRVGRGLASGKGRYAGRGIKGQKSRSGSHTMRAGFEGGQMPIYMRLGKQRGSTSKDAMPIGPHRTHSQGVNVSELERVFDDSAEVTIDALKEKRLIRSTRVDVKILGNGDLKKKLAVTAHAFSASARKKIEGAGGSVTALRADGVANKKKRRKPTGGGPQTASEASGGTSETAREDHENTTTPEA